MSLSMVSSDSHAQVNSDLEITRVYTRPGWILLLFLFFLWELMIKLKTCPGRGETFRPWERNLESRPR